MTPVNGKDVATPSGRYRLVPVPPLGPPSPPRRRSRWTRWVGARDSAVLRAVGVALVVVATIVAFVCVAQMTGCGASQRATRVALVATGSGVAELARANRDAYGRATTALVADLRASGGSLADYDRRVVPLNATLERRGELIRAVDAALYTAAATLDLGRGATPEAIRAAVAAVLATFDLVLVAMADGAVLPPVAIPPALTATVATLRALAPPPADAGAPIGDAHVAG